jgi:hypothetical protein
LERRKTKREGREVAIIAVIADEGGNRDGANLNDSKKWGLLYYFHSMTLATGVLFQQGQYYENLLYCT